LRRLGWNTRYTLHYAVVVRSWSVFNGRPRTEREQSLDRIPEAGDRRVPRPSPEL